MGAQSTTVMGSMTSHDSRASSLVFVAGFKAVGLGSRGALKNMSTIVHINPRAFLRFLAVIFVGSVRVCSYSWYHAMLGVPVTTSNWKPAASAVSSTLHASWIIKQASPAASPLFLF